MAPPGVCCAQSPLRAEPPALGRGALTDECQHGPAHWTPVNTSYVPMHCAPDGSHTSRGQQSRKQNHQALRPLSRNHAEAGGGHTHTQVYPKSSMDPSLQTRVSFLAGCRPGFRSQGMGGKVLCPGQPLHKGWAAARGGKELDMSHQGQRPAGP